MKKISLLIVSALFVSIITGCGQQNNVTTDIEPAKDQNEIVSTVSNILTTELFGDENALKIDLSEYDSLVDIKSPGTYALSGKLDGQIVVNTSEEGKVKLILNGVEITNDYGACIYVKNADKVIISSNEGSINQITSTGKFEQTDEDKVDAAIFSQDDINLNGDGIINVISSYGHGIVSKDKLKIKDGEVNITSYKKGVSGKDGVEIEGGVLNVKSGTNSIDTECDVSIMGGSIILCSERKDGIHADGNVLISDGNIEITKSAEGIEGLTVTMTGGDVSIISSDDGINASGNSEFVSEWQIGANPFLADDGANITISGGNLTVDAGGDGIDSNDTLNITGGVSYISSSTSSADSAIDYVNEALISGGAIVAAGNRGMAEGFSLGSTQVNILYNFDKEYDGGTEITVVDSNGSIIVSFCPNKCFSSVVLSSPEFKLGEMYTMIVSQDRYELQIVDICFTNSQGFGPMGEHPGPKHDMNFKPDGDGRPFDNRIPA